MSAGTVTLNQLHKLVDVVNPKEYDIVYKLLIKFISDEEALPDEVKAIKNLDNAIAKGDTVNYSDINWN